MTPMRERPKRKRKAPKRQATDVNLHPLTARDALRGAMQVDPARVRQAEKDSKAKGAK